MFGNGMSLSGTYDCRSFFPHLLKLNGGWLDMSKWLAMVLHAVLPSFSYRQIQVLLYFFDLPGLYPNIVLQALRNPPSRFLKQHNSYPFVLHLFIPFFLSTVYPVIHLTLFVVQTPSLCQILIPCMFVIK